MKNLQEAVEAEAKTLSDICWNSVKIGEWNGTLMNKEVKSSLLRIAKEAEKKERERILEKAKNVDGDLVDGICVHILMENKWFVRLIQALINSNETK